MLDSTFDELLAKPTERFCHPVLPTFAQKQRLDERGSHRIANSNHHEADPDLGFMARMMALCSLPRTNPGGGKGKGRGAALALPIRLCRR